LRHGHFEVTKVVEHSSTTIVSISPDVLQEDGVIARFDP
jgi:hypothetical protein